MDYKDDVNYAIHEEKVLEEIEKNKRKFLNEDDMAHNITYALGAFFDSILYIDLNTEIYYIVYKDDSGGLQIKKDEDYTAKAQYHINKVVHKDFLEEVKGIYMPEDVRKRLENEPNIESTHLRWNGTEYRWVRIIVHVAERENGVVSKVVYAFKDVHEQKQKELHLQAKLEAALAEAKEANEFKSQFLSNVSHDLRTPMKAIMGLSTLMREKKDLDRIELMDYLDRIDMASYNMLELINSILDLSKLENARMEIQLLDGSISSIINDVVSIIKVQTNEKNQEIEVNNSCTEDLVKIDIVKMRQILLNILSNAVKYTDENGKIHFDVSNKDNVFEFVVQDNGIGMSKEYLKNVFVPFEREERARYIDGIGLGMVIVKKLVELLNGNIDIQSELGSGTKITITIPFELIQEKCLDRDAEKIENNEISRTYENYNILVVEDNEINMFILNEELKQFKCNVDNAFDGLEAVAKFAGSKDGYYDLIIMDLKMPNMDGDIAAKNIRTLQDRVDAKDIPIIIASANSYNIAEEELKKQGITEYVVKPINKNKMAYLLNKYLF